MFSYRLQSSSCLQSILIKFHLNRFFLQKVPSTEHNFTSLWFNVNSNFTSQFRIKQETSDTSSFIIFPWKQENLLREITRCECAIMFSCSRQQNLKHLFNCILTALKINREKDGYRYCLRIIMMLFYKMFMRSEKSLLLWKSRLCVTFVT